MTYSEKFDFQSWIKGKQTVITGLEPAIDPVR